MNLPLRYNQVWRWRQPRGTARAYRSQKCSFWCSFQDGEGLKEVGGGSEHSEKEEEDESWWPHHGGSGVSQARPGLKVGLKKKKKIIIRFIETN